jgi:predicted HicB family RNase H-like nuclease
MERDAVLNMRIPERVKKALRVAAEDERRSVSSLVVVVLEEWLLNRAYLKSAKKRGGRK